MDAAWVAYPAVYEGWQLVDAALRLVDGGTVPDGYQKEIAALPSYIVDTPEAAKALAPSLRLRRSRRATRTSSRRSGSLG